VSGRVGAGTRGAVLLALLALAACPQRGAMADTAGAPGRVTVHAGERFVVRLDANPTTGFGWRLATPPDPSVATPAGSEYVPAPGDLVGSGGEETWRFDAVAPGHTRIVLEYVRPWEHDQPPARTHAVDVTVVPPRELPPRDTSRGGDGPRE
jgi:inhibitor of cysteine peptidase